MTNPINNPWSSENKDIKPTNTSLTQANTAAALLWDNVSPEVDGYTMDVAKYLITHNRAEEVARDYLKYSREGNDTVAFALIDAIDDIYNNDIPEDTLTRYNKWKAL